LIEFKAAYDTIIRNEIYVTVSQFEVYGMSELNFPTKLIRLTKTTLSIVTFCGKIQNDCFESFETRQGLIQGDVLSTLLFNVVLEVIVRRANLQTTGTIYNKETQLLAYADNIDSRSAGRNAYLAFEGEAAKVGLKIYEKKTKCMIEARNNRTIRNIGQSVAIGGKHFEVVKEFVYLGSLMTPTTDVSLEIQRKIQTANRCFFGLCKHLQSNHL
jgi:hypothetical protein